jgi:hypothetical protein
VEQRCDASHSADILQNSCSRALDEDEYELLHNQSVRSVSSGVTARNRRLLQIEMRLSEVGM